MDACTVFPGFSGLCGLFERCLPELSGLDGEGRLSPELVLELEAHAAQCPRCAEERRAYRLVIELVRSLPRRTGPQSYDLFE